MCELVFFFFGAFSPDFVLKQFEVFSSLYFNCFFSTEGLHETSIVRKLFLMFLVGVGMIFLVNNR